MEARPVTDGGSHAVNSSSTAAWAEVDALLRAGAYEELERLLETRRDTGGTDHVHILDAAAQLCLTCIELRGEQDGHNEAIQRVARLEEKTRLRIEQLLESVWRADETETAPLAQPPSMETPQAPRGVSGGESTLADRLQPLRHRLSAFFRPRLEEPPEREVPISLIPPTEVEPALMPIEAESIPLPAEIEPAPMPVEAEPIPMPAEVELVPMSSEVEPVPVSVEAEPVPMPSEVEAEPGPMPAEIEPTPIPARFTPVEPEPPPRPALVTYLLGAFRVYLDDRPIDEWAGSKAKSIFKYLVATRGRPAAQEVLMDLFWPQANVDAARNNLHVAIYGLRQTLHNIQKDFSHILFRDGFYLLNPDLTVWVDVEAFQASLRKGRELTHLGRTDEAIRQYLAAEALYEGDLLEDDRYEEWPQGQRHRLREDYLELLDHLYRYSFERDDYPNSVAACRKMLVMEPSHEAAHRRLIRCYGRLGQRYLAIRQYHQCVEILRRDLDVTPSQETIDLYRQIR